MSFPLFCQIVTAVLQNLVMSVVESEWKSLKTAFTRIYSNWMHYSVWFDICLTNVFNEGTLMIIQIMALSQTGFSCLQAIFGCRTTLSLQEEFLALTPKNFPLLFCKTCIFLIKNDHTALEILVISAHVMWHDMDIMLLAEILPRDEADPQA